jgi:hypothetical protein
MTNKHNDARRHPIPKMTFKVTNWAIYEVGLRRRGSLTLWVSDDAIAAWRTVPMTANRPTGPWSNALPPLIFGTAFSI